MNGMTSLEKQITNALRARGKIVDYMIIEADSPANLQFNVVALIQEGFQPFERPHVTQIKDNQWTMDGWLISVRNHYTQAMVKYESE